ncbi:unnamed protein product [Wickerhamomyces anomalus]
MLGRVNIGGAELEYLLEGEGLGDLIITLHGGRGFGSKESDHSVYKELALSGYRVLSFDFRGHGNSSFTPPFTFKRIVEDIEELRQHFTKDKVIIIGGSFGGFIAQQYAITYPNSLKALVLRVTAPSHHHEADAFKVLEKRLDKAPNVSVEMLRKVFSSFDSDEEFRLTIFAMLPLYSETYDANQGLKSALKTKYRAQSHNELYSEQEKYFDYREGLKQLNVPTLIIVGDKDWICPPKQSQLIHSLVKDSELLEVEGANHSAHLEKRALVLDKISSFLRDRL